MHNDITAGLFFVIRDPTPHSLGIGIPKGLPMNVTDWQFEHKTCVVRPIDFAKYPRQESNLWPAL